MSAYNIIYTSPTKSVYLWNGSSFDDLKAKGREVLFYSGKSVKSDGLEDALFKCESAVKQYFPDDTKPLVKPVEVKVSN